MNSPDLFERVVVSLQEAALGKARWSEAALLIGQISGTRGGRPGVRRRPRPG